MAEDLRLYSDFLNNPKTQLLRRRLGDVGVLALIQLWCAVANSYPDGDLSGKSDEFIEILAGWLGNYGEFTSTLRELRFLDGTEQHSKLHNWAKRQPWVVERPKRSERGRRAAFARYRKDADNKQRLAILGAARAKGTHTDSEWREMARICGNVCARCKQNGKLTKDHIAPITLTGNPLASDAIANLQPLCDSCNSRKGDLFEASRPEEHDYRPPNWEQLLRQIVPAAPRMPNACIRYAHSTAPSHPVKTINKNQGDSRASPVDAVEKPEQLASRAEPKPESAVSATAVHL